jgi:DNA transposition AAA+ family ATPase
MLNNNWELIKDEMWRKVGTQINALSNEWVTVETRAFTRISGILSDAKEYSNVFALTGDAGSGKTHTINAFAADNANTYVLHCNEYWNRKLFLNELLREMGRNAAGHTVGEMMSDIVRTLKTSDRPLVVLDEADKLNDQVLYFFITLYNQLEGSCGLVLCATSHLELRMRRGIRLGKKGYTEIFSRFGRKFIAIQNANKSDIRAICISNGITAENFIRSITDDAEANDRDLRRVERRIHAVKRQIEKGVKTDFETYSNAD